MRIIIDNYDAMIMLMDRVKFWTQDEDTIELFRKMYEQYVFEGCFNDTEFNVEVIVDNDYVNWCGVISEGDDDYEEVKKAYEKDNRELDHMTIEAEHNGQFLVRYY